MAHRHTITLEPEKLSLGSIAGRLGIPGLLVGALALGGAAWLGFHADGGHAAWMESHFYFSYLAAFSFFTAITLGALVFVMIHHLARAAWSVTVRRLAEGLALNMFLLVILLAPLIKGMDQLLPWLTQSDENILAKSGYLNPTFFYIRIVAYFGFWCILAWFFSSRSVKQDQTGDPGLSKLMEKVAAPGVILFGFSLTAFAFDWIMALNAHWFSTIFGVYYFAGAFLSVNATIVLLSLSLKKRGRIGEAINNEHYHDLGKWMFAFTFFWGYIAFAQYMLIWYANLPEETQFFIPRQIGHWASISLALLAVHLLIPFPGLLSRHVKRKNTVLAFWAVWSLCACAVDIYWLVIPNEWIQRISQEVAGKPGVPLQNTLSELTGGTTNIYQLSPQHASFAEEVNYAFGGSQLLVTALCFIGIGGLYVFSTMLALRGRSLVPTRDPRLTDSLAFENI